MDPRTGPTPDAPSDKGSASTRPTDAARAPLRREPGPEPLRSSAPEPHAPRGNSAICREPDLPSNTSIVRHHAAPWLSLISPRDRTWRCTTRPPRTRTFSTTLQYRCSLPSLRRVLQRTNMNKSSAHSAPESTTKVGTTQGVDGAQAQKTETYSVNHPRKSAKHMVSWRSRASRRGAPERNRWSDSTRARQPVGCSEGSNYCGSRAASPRTCASDTSHHAPGGPPRNRATSR